MKETTAQEASGATIAAGEDLRVARFSLPRDGASSRIDTVGLVERLRRAPAKRPWTLPDPWTHKTRPPVLGKPRTVSHKRPPPSSCL